MRIAYIQSIGGASGDMLLGALLDLGLSLDDLREDLAKLNVSGYQLAVSEETRQEMRGTKMTVVLDDEQRRSPGRLREIVRQSSLPLDIKAQADRVLEALWQAESRVHGMPEDTLELDELGSVDTLVDVVGVVAGLSRLGVEEVFASPLVLGASEPPRWAGGYPNPAPATLELVANSGAPISIDRPYHQGAGELTTPTGAALITTLAAFRRPEMSVTGIGSGLGTKDPEGFPNVTRIWLGEMARQGVQSQQGEVILLETNLDDVSGQILGYTQEQLFVLGALDVWHTPVQMKKSRPGVVFSALVPRDLEAAAVELIMRETPTLGVRTRAVDRYVATRQNMPMETDLGLINVKVKYLDQVAIGAAPEYEDCRRIAQEAGLPLQEIYQRAMAQARQTFLE